MTVTAIKIMFVLGILGHALNMYCDRILSIFPLKIIGTLHIAAMVSMFAWIFMI